MTLAAMTDRAASKLIDTLGGAQAVADRTGERRGTVDTWKSREIIPRRKWPDFLLAYPTAVGLSDLLGTERVKAAAGQSKSSSAAVPA